MEIAVYTSVPGDEHRVFNYLDSLKEKYPSNLYLHIVGGDQENEPFITWAKVNNVRFKEKKILWDKYGFSAMRRAIKDLITQSPIDLFVIMYVDSYSLEITHILRERNVKVLSNLR